MEEQDARPFGLVDHPLRAALSSEMHVRKLPPITAPARMLHIVALREDNGDAEQARLTDLSGRDAEALRDARFLSTRIGDLDLIWERHSESSSYMFIRRGPFAAPFDAAAFAAIPQDWFAGLGLAVIRATLIAFTQDDTIDIDASFAGRDLIVSDLADGTARIWSDFRLHDDGFGRVLLRDHGLQGAEAPLLIQRLQELGNYRNMALLGLPVVQRMTPRLSALEAQLAVLTNAVADGSADDDALLHDLSALSAELATIVAATRYRMSASRAYADIVQDRLAALNISAVRGHPTLADFTDRRLLPAMRTCISFSARLDDLSQRVAWTSSLLRTRVDTALSRQNRDLLHSMDRRTDLQLRLQQTVEGLSVVAISYYLVGLLGYALKGAEERIPLPHAIVQAIAVPVVLVLVAIGMRRVKARLHQG